MSGQLVGKVAIVTGSGRNIGRAIAMRFARAGADVVVNSRSNRAEASEVAQAVRELGRRAVVVVADVSERDGAEAVAQVALEELGRIDVLVNTVAIRPHKPFLGLEPEEWGRVHSAVVDTAMHCTQAVLPPMIAQGGGSVLFLIGEGAWRGGAERGHIGAAKMSLIGLSRSLATEFGPRGVRFNSVSPGRIDTARGPGSRPDHIDASNIPLGRLGHPDDIANACLFLASDQASWITGQTLHVNGGQSYH